ncbi:MAG: hypothetical protein ACLPYS_00835 [Vulcanimicrobiaceae bacterium]
MSALESTLSDLDRGPMHLNVAGVDAMIEAPLATLAVLDRMLAPVSREWTSRGEPVQVDIRHDDDVWYISEATTRSRKVLGRESAAPQVAGAAASTLISAIAKQAGLTTCRASVVEWEGNAFAMVGDDWESCITLTAHLHARGARILGGDYALIDAGEMSVTSFKKLLYTPSSCLDSLPLKYRRAVEASPWYSTPHGIAFYAVDPSLAGASPWAERGTLRGVLKVDGHIAEYSSLETIADFDACGGLSSSTLERAGVEVAMLTIGGFVETCDLLQCWFSRFA